MSSFDEQFEKWLSERLRAIKQHQQQQQQQQQSNQQRDITDRDIINSSQHLINNNINKNSYSSTENCCSHLRARSRPPAQHHVVTSSATMTHRQDVRAHGRHSVGSPAGNYYRFVYDEDDDDEEDVGSDEDVTMADELRRSPTRSAGKDASATRVKGQQAEPEDNISELQSVSRLQRLSRLLGPEAILNFDISELDDDDIMSADVNQNFSTAGHTPGVHPNHPTLAAAAPGDAPLHSSRAQNYSTTSLEFSDADSFLSATSDTMQRLDMVDGEDVDGDWTLVRRDGTQNQDDLVNPHGADQRKLPGVDFDEEFVVSREPISFVEFSRTANTGQEAELEMARRLFDDDPSTIIPAAAGHRPLRPASGRKARKQPGLDEMVSVRYRKTDLYGDSADDGGDFIDDDMLLQRQLPLGAVGGADVTSTGDVTGETEDAAGEPLEGATKLRGILPVETSMELGMDDMFNYEDDIGADDHVTKDRAPIVRPDSAQRGKRTRATTCCRRHRRLLLGIAIATAVVMAIAIGVITYVLVDALRGK